jgi:hypothetical protein
MPLSKGAAIAIQAGLTALQMAITASQEIEGPRLDDLSVTTAEYGTVVNYLYGVRRFNGVSCIWAEPLREVKRRRKTKGGKFNDYSYFGTFAVLVADQPCEAILKILFDRNVVYDATGTGPVSSFGSGDSVANYMRIYLGSETQDPDPRMQATIEAALGAGFCPAYRGCTYIVFEDLPLEKIGNRLPQVSVVAATAGNEVFPFETKEKSLTLGPLTGFSYSADHSRFVYSYDGHYEIWDANARAQMVAGDLDGSVWGGPTSLAPLNTRLYGLNITGDELVSWPNDGIGAQISHAALTYPGTGTVGFITPAGGELVAVPSGITFPTHYAAQVYDPLLDVVTETDTLGTGAAGAQMVSGYCQTTQGDIYAVSHPYDVLTTPTDTIATLTRLTAIGDTAAVINLTGLPASSTFARVHAMHVDGAFVVSYDGTDLYLIDDQTGAVLAHRALVHSANVGAQFRSAYPGAASVWLDSGSSLTAMQISTADLTTLQTITFGDWIPSGVGLSADAIVYNEATKALIGVPGYPNSDAITWYYLDRMEGAGVLLSDIIEDVAERSKLEPTDIDAADCDQTVTGYSWTQGQGAQILSPLLEAYDSEVRPHNFLQEFRRRGVTSLGTIARDDFIGGYALTKTGDGDLPLSATMTFADIAIDQQPNSATAQRAATAADTARQMTLDGGTLALDADTARQIITGLLRRRWFEAEKVSLSLTRGFSVVEPGDVYTLTLDDVTRTEKIARLVFSGDGKLNLDWVRNSPKVHIATDLPGAPADGIGTGTVIVAGYTKGVVLDIPLPSDAEDSLAVWLAAAPYSDDIPWPGADFLRSDDGVTYEDTLGSVASSERASIGYALDALPDALATVIDHGSTLTVKMFDGDLTSCTEAQALDGANQAQLGDERIHFITATLVDANTYELTGLLRGRRGTEWATAGHAAGEDFVLLAGEPKVVMGASDLGDTIYYQPVTNGGLAGFVQVQEFEGRSLKPYSPAHLEAEDVSGDIVLDWLRRTRIGGFNVYGSTPPLGETSEAYEVDILDGADAVIRTITGLSSPTGTYTAAMISADGGLGETAKAYQISSVVGRGYPATVAI